MEQLFTQESRNQAGYQMLSGRAWTAYTSLILVCSVLFVADFLVGRMSSLPRQAELLFAVAVMLILFSGIAIIRTTRYYCNDLGIWCLKGILPWKRGVTGLRWENLETVGYEANFGAWLTQSYTIILHHRYTSNSSMRLTQVWKGRDTVQKINQQFLQWQSQQASRPVILGAYK